MIKSFLLAALACCLATIPAFANVTGTRFSAELMVRNEGVGDIAFSPDRQWVYFDRQLPYREKVRYDTTRDWNRGLSVLQMARVDGSQSLELRDGPLDRTWLVSVSPDSRYVVFGWLDGLEQRLGIFDHATGTSRRLPLSASSSAGNVAMWTSDTRLLMLLDPEAESPWYTSLSAQNLRQRMLLSEQSWRGEAAVTVWGSGPYARRRDKLVQRLVLLDVATVTWEVLDSGAYTPAITAAPRQGRSAWAKQVGVMDVSDMRGKEIGLSAARREPVIVEPDGRLVRPMACDDCAVERPSMKWSPDGQRLFYSLRYKQADRFVHRHFVYEVARGQSRELDVLSRSLALEIVADSQRFEQRVLWLDDQHLLVRGAKPVTDADGRQGYRWSRVGMDGSVQPFGDDAGPLEKVVAIHAGNAFFLSHGRLWRVDREGAAVRIDTGGRVERWCEPAWHMRSLRYLSCDLLEADVAIASRYLPLEVVDEGRVVGWRLLDMEDGGLVELSPPPGKKLVTLADGGMPAVFLGQGEGADELVLAMEDGGRRVLHRYNAHLADVAAIEQVLLERVDPESGDARNDWLLLPADRTPGKRLPLLVYFYPDTQYGKALTWEDVRTVTSINTNIAVARGYAVLLASMRISPQGENSGQPMREMHAQLIRAAENAVAQGYVDPQRWAIMGHSYGGYGVNSVITQTDRFKAAISLAGLSNITSAYASGLHYLSTRPLDGLPHGLTWAEGHQGRMGVPPWENPQRYVDNSPVFWADRIQTPLMLVHGDIDFVNISEAEQMFNVLLRQNKPAQLLRYWGEDHRLASPANIVDLWERIGTFLDEHLGAP